MTEKNNQNFSEETIDKNRWSDFLRRFIEVLWINIFVVDYLNQSIVFSQQDGEITSRFGTIFLSKTFGIDLSNKSFDFIKQFTPQGEYWELKNSFDLHLFAVPIKIEDQIVAHLIVGPIIFNRKRENDEYRKIAEQSNITLKIDDFLDAIHEVRVVSFLTMKAILDLLFEVAKDVIELSIEKRKIYQTRFNKPIIPKKIADTFNDIYTTIHIDELLITILDVALNLTQAECGSIMLLDEQKQHLVIKVSKGLKQTRMLKTRHKIGEGIAGIAAQRNEAMIIHGAETNNAELKNLLKRPEIKKAAIIPLLSEHKGVLGVLNVHTKSDIDRIEDNMDNLQIISKLISAALHSM